MIPTFQAKQLFAFVLALLAAASMWTYVRRINVRHQEKEALQFDHPRGNLSDLYPRWLGARELLLRGRDPYSRQITSEIQRGYYGRELDPTRPNDPKDLEAFAYPVYVVFLLAPTVHMDFSTVRLLSLWLLTGLTVLSIPLWQSAMGLELSLWGSLTVVVLVLGSYPFVEAISLQQLSLLVGALLAGSFLMRQCGWLFLSGALLAVATIKPHVALLPLILMIMWLAGDWRERRRWLWGFGSTIVALAVASEYILPGWIFRFYEAIRSYTIYIGRTSFLDLLLTPRWGGMGRALIVLIVVWVCWKSRELAPDASGSRRALSLALVAAVCIAPNRATYNQVLLLPGLFLLFGEGKSFQQGGIFIRQLKRVVWGLLVWPWLASGFLTLARAVFHAESLVLRAWQLPLYTTLSLPVVLLVLLLANPSATVSSHRTFPTPEILA